MTNKIEECKSKIIIHPLNEKKSLHSSQLLLNLLE